MNANDQQLPEGWANSILEAITSKIVDGSHNPPKEQSSGFAMISARNVNNGKITFENIRYANEEDFCIEHRRTNISPNDVLLTIVGTIGRSAVVPEGLKPFIAQRSVSVIKTIVISSYFLHYQFQTKSFQDLLSDKARGSAQKGVYLKTLSQMPIIIAPLSEQKRISAKLDNLLPRVSKVSQRLEKAETILKKFRQSVLSAAVTGKLTEDWREKHLNTVTLDNTIKNNILKTDVVDIDSLPYIPDSWTWTYLSKLGELNRGKSRHRPRNAPHLFGGPYPFIQTGDIAQSGGRIVSHKQTYSKAGLSQSRLWPTGTVCITIAANIADSAILTYPACFPDSVVGFIANTEIVESKYIEFFIRTARKDLSQYAPATAQKNINIAILSKVAVPIPPLDEQKEIVRRVETLFAMADKIKTQIKAVQTKTGKLPQSILNKAFTGQLVPTEADLARLEGRSYETAEQLLARIQAEKQIPSIKTRKATKKKIAENNKRITIAPIDAVIKPGSSNRPKKVKPKNVVKINMNKIKEMKLFRENHLESQKLSDNSFMLLYYLLTDYMKGSFTLEEIKPYFTFLEYNDLREALFELIGIYLETKEGGNRELVFSFKKGMMK